MKCNYLDNNVSIQIMCDDSNLYLNIKNAVSRMVCLNR